MKKCVMVVLLAGALVYSSCARAQMQEAEQLLLNVEKLAQLKSILEDLKKGYQIVFEGYTTIKNLSEGSFQLHQVFLDGLLQVSPVVKNYRRIPDIIRAQISLVKEYKVAYRQFVESGQFSVEEVSYLEKVYENLFNQSVKSLEVLASVITAGELRMSDEERLTAIDTIWKDVSESLTFLRHFNGEAKVLALQRAKGKVEISLLQKLFSIKK
jgi:hypothetical protein